MQEIFKAYSIGASNDDFHVRIKVYDGGSIILDTLLDIFDIGGATYVLNALGYERMERSYV